MAREQAILRKGLAPGLIALLFLALGGLKPAWAHHTDPGAWVEAPALAGCNHCHATTIEFNDAAATLRPITMYGTGARIGLPKENTAQATQLAKIRGGNWTASITFMSGKESVPIPYNETVVVNYLNLCYPANATGSPTQACDVANATSGYTVNDNCSCAGGGPITPKLRTAEGKSRSERYSPCEAA